jgi:hypothetical protein
MIVASTGLRPGFRLLTSCIFYPGKYHLVVNTWEKREKLGKREKLPKVRDNSKIA